MKKGLLLALFAGIAIFVFIKKEVSTQKVVEKPTTANAPVITPTSIPEASSTTLFVPYWTLTSAPLPKNVTALAYFGIDANTNGIDTTDAGFRDIEEFVQKAPKNEKTYLVVSLLDENTDEKILYNKDFQQKMVSQSIAIAQKYGFTGIILDLEYKALSFDEVIATTTNFTKNFATAAHKNKLLFYQALYGDTIFLLRPYDVAAIGKNTDGIFILAYDFHKTDGNPGPNFPLHPLPDEDYSFVQMIQDFKKQVPIQKLRVVYGMFGYDWEINRKGESTDTGVSLTTQEAQQKFLPTCALSDCVVLRDKIASEMQVKYKDSQDNMHEVWFEDMQSVNQKENYASSQGINASGFWAYGYF